VTRRRQEESQADQLVDLALDWFSIGKTDRGEPFAVPKVGAYVAIMFSGGRGAFRAKLASDYRKKYKKVANSAALTAC